MILDRDANKLVSYSRAGDVFHYRWAARRCLRLIQPTTKLESVIIEGSKEREKAGEYVIDVAEYYNDGAKKRIEYYQLKHTTVQQNEPFTLSGLKDTIEGFAERFQQHYKEKSLDGVSFTIITNRKIDGTFKKNINDLLKGATVHNRFSQTLKNYTKLDGKELKRFCSLLNLEDSEGDYKAQKEDLRIEMARLQPGTIDPAQVASIVSLVQEKVLPDSNGIIRKEDILRPFGITSEEHLFPAPPLFESVDKITIRAQYQELLDTIVKSDHPVIIHAEGGVGKSVFCQYLLGALPDGSLGIAYDCFGSGEYRRRSRPRHRHRDALVQISNELASTGLCERMLVKDTTQENDIMRDFLSRIKSSLKYLKQSNAAAQLFLLIDAADNAEMAAQEFGNSCFANEILREEFPEDCRLILLCRPERIHLLSAPDHIPQLKLLPFSKEETFENLAKWHPEVSENEAYEFHRLTSGNPRVQMNAISAGHSSVNELLRYLGPSGTTVEKQIEQQLNKAVQKVKNNLPLDYQSQVLKICTGLASLPPNIPIEVLSRASEVKAEDVKSFIADIGRSLWLLDSSVQFRDEPTETWFRKTYLGSKDDFNSYIKILEPLAGEFTYVAEVLPQLYLQAGQYDQLIDIALSDRLLPSNNPIDTRNVLVYRLQFAFKAALKAGKNEDSIKLALRAGEEVAGDQRQQDLFQSNIDLLPKLQDNLKVQEIAFKGLLRSGWEGSENVYTASLLSEIEEYRGEANSYLRSALNWLQIYFEESKKKKDRRPHHGEGVNHGDILEIALTQLKVGGVKMCLGFLNSLRPKEFIFQVMKRLVNRLIDAGRFDEIDEILEQAHKNKYHVIAIVSELERVGRFAEAKNLEECLNALANTKKRIKRSRDSFNDTVTPAIITFLEACLHRKLATKTILKVLDHYVPAVPSRGVGARYDAKERITFLKALSIRNVLSKEAVINLDELADKVFKSDKERRKYTDDIREFKEVIGGLIPWYLLRVQVISGDLVNLDTGAKQASESSRKAYSNRYRSYDTLPNEITNVCSSILTYCGQQKPDALWNYYEAHLKGNSSFSVDQRISLLRVGHRAEHLDHVIAELENSTFEFIKGLKEARPEETAEHYISLARAVLSGSKDDAAVYFEEAISVVSKFGDEAVERWEAVAALGHQSAPSSSNELAYRFVRCAELIGEYVDREKHWDRSGALVTGAKMSAPIAISALSRWRDREIGRFEYQLESLLNHLVNAEVISPRVGWSMARFFSYHDLNEFVSACLSKEESDEVKQRIFNDAYELLSKEGAGAAYWKQLKSIGDKYNIRVNALDSTVDFYEKDTKQTEPSNAQNPIKDRTKSELDKWDRIFKEVDVLQPDGLAILLNRFLVEFKDEDDYYFWRPINLYQEALKRIEADQVHDFISALLSFQKISHYECQQVLSSIPKAWKDKVSFKKKWHEAIRLFGAKYSHQLVSIYSFQSTVRELDLDDDLTVELRKGIFHGLSEGQEFKSASALFGFVRQAATFVSADAACILADYALSRFELHIDNGFADGPWDEWLHVSSDVSQNLAGFIWSALGSPRSEMRWKACHVVKTLSDFSCTQLLDSLIEWLKHDKVDAFGSQQFPFYNLHARQYLLIALSRVSIDHSGLLVAYKDVFLKYALTEPHVLIQKYSADIAQRIEMGVPETYNSTEIYSLKKVGKSELASIENERGNYIDSYLHQQGKLGDTQDYRSAFDFREYWYEPLGEVFGVSAGQIDELCADVVVNEWKVGTEIRFDNDPRVSLWNRSQDRETWYHKSSYPKTDTWNFYRSYHSMLCVAAKLIQNMPVISASDSWHEEEPWDYWLSRHVLTNMDGKWLADFRGALPLERPEWTSREEKYEEWRTNFQDQDFLTSIKAQHGNEAWLNIKGGWTERHNSRYETYSISAALVSKRSSEALLRALETCSNSHDYKLPDYQEESVEIDSGIFKLKGFIDNPDSSKGIDEFDPYAANLSYPPFTFGEQFLKDLGLKSEDDGKTWCFSNGQVALRCDIWSGAVRGYDEEPEQSGMRLSASLYLLKELCNTYDSDLIIDVNISRDMAYKYRPDNHEYLNPSNKIYIFSADGRLKSTGQNIKLR